LGPVILQEEEEIHKSFPNEFVKNSSSCPQSEELKVDAIDGTNKSGELFSDALPVGTTPVGGLNSQRYQARESKLKKTKDFNASMQENRVSE